MIGRYAVPGEDGHERRDEKRFEKGEGGKVSTADSRIDGREV